MAIDGSSVLQLLDSAGAAYSVSTHRPIYTVDEGDALNLPHPEAIARTLFLCDDKKQHYWLVTLPKAKKLDLKELRAKLQSRRLTFAGKDELAGILKLPLGAATPLGALNDKDCTVKAVIDSAFKESLIGVPLLANTATIWLNGSALAQLLTQHGSTVIWLDI